MYFYSISYHLSKHIYLSVRDSITCINLDEQSKNWLTLINNLNESNKLFYLN